MAVFAVLGVALFFAWRGPIDPAPSAADGGGGTLPTEEQKAPPARCRRTSGEPAHRIGDGSAQAAPDPVDAGDFVDEPDLDPFAVELGRGEALASGWAVGSRRVDKGEPWAEVVVIGDSGSKIETIKLDKARGDLDAPIVRAAPQGKSAGGKSFVAAMLEPDASGLSLRLARHHEGKLEWGAEIHQGRDESLGLDLGLAAEVVVVVWDDVSDDGTRGRVLVATVKAADLSLADPGEPVTGEQIDAEAPRVVPRSGGFWLAYVARALSKGAPDADADGRFAAERIEPSWIELMPLDASGRPDGAARAITPEKGYVLAFDLAAATDGGAIVAWRDDDTPSGAEGGRLSIVAVSPSGGEARQQVVADREVGAGAPTLLAGWLAFSDDQGKTRLVPVEDDGQVDADPRREPAIGVGQVIAARGAQLLVARPEGRAIDLDVLSCERGR